MLTKNNINVNGATVKNILTSFTPHEDQRLNVLNEYFNIANIL